MSKPTKTLKNKPTAREKPTPLGLWIGAVAVVLLAIFAIVFMRQPTAATNQLTPEVSINQAAELRDQGAFILDVREPEEWNEYHIPGATLIPLAQLASRVEELPQDQPIVVVCRSGNRSQSGRDILKQAGFASVTSMAGGVSQWRSAGLPTVSGP